MNCKNHTLQLKAMLKENKLKATPGRLQILDIFHHSKKPLSVNQLVDTLDQLRLDKVTLYRNVELLEYTGLLKKIRLNDRKSYYELTAQEHHHHVICKRCGRIKDMKGCGITVTEKSIATNSNFATITSHALEFFGICKKCYKK